MKICEVGEPTINPVLWRWEDTLLIWATLVGHVYTDTVLVLLLSGSLLKLAKGEEHQWGQGLVMIYT